MKGYVYTLEVMLAISILAIAVLTIFGSAPEKPDLGISIIKQRSWESLMYVDSADLLRQHVKNGNESAIERELVGILPVNYKFEIDICQSECSTGNIPGNKSVVSTDYYVSAYRDNFIGKKVKMWVWTGL